MVLHLQDMGQAREALQKPKTSKHKPQSRAMAGPCHLGQGDIPSCQCQSVRVRVSQSVSQSVVTSLQPFVPASLHHFLAFSIFPVNLIVPSCVFLFLSL